MRRNQNELAFGAARALTNDVARLIGMHLQTCIGQELGQMRSSQRFVKRWRGYFGDADLLLGYRSGFAGELRQGLPHTRIGGDRRRGGAACPNGIARREHSHSREHNAQRGHKS